MKLFNHIQIKVKDLKTSRRFYDAIMETLSHPVVLEIRNAVIGYGTSIYDMFEIQQYDDKSPWYSGKIS